MLTREENEMMTRVGRGTPAGEMLRRYWWPIGFTEEITPKSRPNKIKLLGEEFVLFRSGAGEVGLLALHCCHRGASLQYGRVEEQGIRCCYHGWVYDVNGRCLEQPAEPEESTFKDRVKQPAYTVQELGGLIFAYIGPEPAPLLPRYDLLVRNDGTRVLDATKFYCNWFQTAENTVDQTHIPFLHANGYPKMAFRKPNVGCDKTWYGLRSYLQLDNRSKPKVTHCIFPAHNRFTVARVGDKPNHRLIFRVPTDDTEVANFGIRFYPAEHPLILRTEGWKKNEPGVYKEVDDEYWGIESIDTDRAAVESEGLIYDRRQEHLATSDRGVIMLRQIIKECVEAVKENKDPMGVVRDSTYNEIITFDAEMDEIGPLV